MLSSRPQHIISEGVYYAPTKTPARSRARAENAIQGTVKNVGPKGKGVAAPRTPFGPASTKPNHLLKEVLATQGKAGTSLRQNRPLGDKTPFPNRAQNFDGQGTAIKIPKLVFAVVDAQKVAAASPEMQRPSSTRKHIRSRKSLQQSFQTPVNNGRHWEVGEELGSPEVQTQEPILEEDDFDEIEYMPPNTLDLPYQPPVDFDLPDYRALGQAFRKSVFSAPVDDVEPPPLIMPTVEVLPDSLVRLTLPDIDDDDPFRSAQEPVAKAPLKSSVHTKLGARTRPVSAVPPSGTLRPTSTTQPSRARPATAASHLPAKPVTRATSTNSSLSRRPGTYTAAPITRAATTTTRSTATARSALPAKSSVSKAAPSSRNAAQTSRAGSNPTTARSTPLPRGAVTGKAKPATPAAPALFKDIPLELDDFMFEV